MSSLVIVVGTFFVVLSFAEFFLSAVLVKQGQEIMTVLWFVCDLAYAVARGVNPLPLRYNQLSSLHTIFHTVSIWLPRYLYVFIPGLMSSHLGAIFGYAEPLLLNFLLPGQGVAKMVAHINFHAGMVRLHEPLKTEFDYENNLLATVFGCAAILVTQFCVLTTRVLRRMLYISTQDVATGVQPETLLRTDDVWQFTFTFATMWMYGRFSASWTDVFRVDSKYSIGQNHIIVLLILYFVICVLKKMCINEFELIGDTTLYTQIYLWAGRELSFLILLRPKELPVPVIELMAILFGFAIIEFSRRDTFADSGVTAYLRIARIFGQHRQR
jgi:hypothetical protein